MCSRFSDVNCGNVSMYPVVSGCTSPRVQKEPGACIFYNTLRIRRGLLAGILDSGLCGCQYCEEIEIVIANIVWPDSITGYGVKLCLRVHWFDSHK